jgi:hypothetical protein
MQEAKFELSVNHVHKTAVGHKSGCLQAKKHAGGKSRVQEHFDGADTPLVVALTAERQFREYAFNWCSFCCHNLRAPDFPSPKI